MSVESNYNMHHETTFMLPNYGYQNNSSNSSSSSSQMDLQQEQRKFLNYFKSNLPPKEFHDQVTSHSKYNDSRTSYYLSPPLSTIAAPTSTAKRPTSTPWNYTWLVFMNEKWVPFDITNQTKLEQTLTVGGTFVDITDTHFPAVKRVRVFPKSNYLSYLGVKYRLSRIMQPDAYLDHMSVAEAKRKPFITLT